MSSQEPSKITGAKDRVVGGAKETFGKVVGNERMQAEGKQQNLQGKAEIEAARAHQEVKGRTEELTGQAKETYGNLAGDTQKKVEGQMEQTQGSARRATNL